MTNTVFDKLFEDEFSFLKGSKKKVGNYLLGKLLGEGSFAKVRLGVHVLTREKVAIKIINKKLVTKRDYVKKYFRREATILQRLDHPNIVRLYEVLETDNSYYMVTEYVEGESLHDFMNNRKHLREDETRLFMRQVISAVDHMHRTGVVHRDIKLDNFLIDKKHHLRIIDFGLSNLCTEGSLLETQCGSPAYAAPEIFSREPYGSSVDIWSIGVNLYVMLTGGMPFDTHNMTNLTQLHFQILKGCKIPDRISKDGQDLLRRLLCVDAKNRITMLELLGHPWVNKGLGSLLQHSDLKSSTTPSDVDYDILRHMSKEYGISENDSRDALVQGKINASSAIYRLLMDRKQRGEGLPKRDDMKPGDIKTRKLGAIVDDLPATSKQRQKTEMSSVKSKEGERLGGYIISNERCNDPEADNEPQTNSTKSTTSKAVPKATKKKRNMRPMEIPSVTVKTNESVQPNTETTLDSNNKPTTKSDKTLTKSAIKGLGKNKRIQNLTIIDPNDTAKEIQTQTPKKKDAIDNKTDTPVDYRILNPYTPEVFADDKIKYSDMCTVLDESIESERNVSLSPFKPNKITRAPPVPPNSRQTDAICPSPMKSLKTVDLDGEHETITEENENREPEQDIPDRGPEFPEICRSRTMPTLRGQKKTHRNAPLYRAFRSVEDDTTNVNTFYDHYKFKARTSLMTREKGHTLESLTISKPESPQKGIRRPGPSDKENTFHREKTIVPNGVSYTVPDQHDLHTHALEIRNQMQSPEVLKQKIVKSILLKYYNPSSLRPHTRSKSDSYIKLPRVETMSDPGTTEVAEGFIDLRDNC
ncbi:unnamed protein product [Owenia fusiformis]|uniref:non-specific serine/threonine protein kinase n=1 Tax=Owenia fusiformis TaxID=6347 RepID=A0A8J1TDP2_OWEFU|nr:unnamed protein product [Owenia fusiformis]